MILMAEVVNEEGEDVFLELEVASLALLDHIDNRGELPDDGDLDGVAVVVLGWVRWEVGTNCLKMKPMLRNASSPISSNNSLRCSA